MSSAAEPHDTADPFDQGRPRRVRTYSGRRGRLSPLTLDRLDRFGSSRFLPAGPVDAATAFGRVAPLVLEVGSGHGAAAIAYAREHPDHDVLAVDVHTPGIARMLAAADAVGVPNLRVVRGDAVELLTTRIAPGQVAVVHLFFPDPWPKNRHAKRRFVGAATLSLLASRLAHDGLRPRRHRPGGICGARAVGGRGARGVRRAGRRAAVLAADGRLRAQGDRRRPAHRRAAARATMSASGRPPGRHTGGLMERATRIELA